MYRVYTTDAFVLGSKNAGEANKYLYLFTRELGLIIAFAQGVRELKSKLRYVLQDYARVNISLVRGKEKWRITSAVSLDEIFSQQSSDTLKLRGKVFSLLQRFVRGEEEDAFLFDELAGALAWVARQNVNQKILHDFELILVLRLMSRLGYIAPDNAWSSYMAPILWNTDSLPEILNRKALAAVINEAFYHSQL